MKTIVNLACATHPDGHTSAAFNTLTPGIVIHRPMVCPEKGEEDATWVLSHARSGIAIAFIHDDNPEGGQQLAHLLGAVCDWTTTGKEIETHGPELVAVIRQWGAELKPSPRPAHRSTRLSA